jgi:hypothetical protein
MRSRECLRGSEQPEPQTWAYHQTSTCRPGASDDFHRGHLGVSPWLCLAVSIFFWFRSLSFSVPALLENLMMLIFVEFRCECHLSHRDRDAIRNWPSNSWQLLWPWLIWARAKTWNDGPRRKRPMIHWKGHFFIGMVPFCCGPKEFWHIYTHIISANHFPSQLHSEVVELYTPSCLVATP